MAYRRLIPTIITKKAWCALNEDGELIPEPWNTVLPVYETFLKASDYNPVKTVVECKITFTKPEPKIK